MTFTSLKYRYDWSIGAIVMPCMFCTVVLISIAFFIMCSPSITLSLFIVNFQRVFIATPLEVIHMASCLCPLLHLLLLQIGTNVFRVSQILTAWYLYSSIFRTFRRVTTGSSAFWWAWELLMRESTVFWGYKICFPSWPWPIHKKTPLTFTCCQNGGWSYYTWKQHQLFLLPSTGRGTPGCL